MNYIATNHGNYIATKNGNGIARRKRNIYSYKKKVKLYAFRTLTNEKNDQSFVLFFGLNLGGNGRDTRINKSARVSPYIIVLKGFMGLPIP